MKILILGANGYVGSRIYFDIRNKYNVIGTYKSVQLHKEFINVDITDTQQLNSVVRSIKPDIIIHTANNASSRWCEANPDEAILLNQTSTEHVIDATQLTDAKLIYFSSFAAYEPTSIYGKTKINSEKMIQKSIKNFVIIRPSAIFGYSPNTTNDKLFNKLLQNLNSKLPRPYDISWKFQPSYIGHLTKVIEAIIDQKITNEIIPVAVPELSTIYNTIQDILTPFGVIVTPIDNHDTSHFSRAYPLDELQRLNLPQFTYSQMIQSIIEEIENKNKYIL